MLYLAVTPQTFFSYKEPFAERNLKCLSSAPFWAALLASGKVILEKYRSWNWKFMNWTCDLILEMLHESTIYLCLWNGLQVAYSDGYRWKQVLKGKQLWSQQFLRFPLELQMLQGMFDLARINWKVHTFSTFWFCISASVFGGDIHQECLVTSVIFWPSISHWQHELFVVIPLNS